jgi:hypothetical protein
MDALPFWSLRIIMASLYFMIICGKRSPGGPGEYNYYYCITSSPHGSGYTMMIHYIRIKNGPGGKDPEVIGISW